PADRDRRQRRARAARPEGSHCGRPAPQRRSRARGAAGGRGPVPVAAGGGGGRDRGRERGDGAGDPGRERRAGTRSAWVGARRVRRSGAAARLRRGRPAGDAGGRRAGGRRRPLRAWDRGGRPAHRRGRERDAAAQRLAAGEDSRGGRVRASLPGPGPRAERAGRPTCEPRRAVPRPPPRAVRVRRARCGDRGRERARVAGDGRPGARAAARPADGAGARPGVGSPRRGDDVGRRGVDGAAEAGRLVEDGAVSDPAGLQVLAAALRGVAEEMGAALVRSAHSANIKERRDCSTAVFDPGGRMIAQAEHLPVHLGAMPDAVAAVLERGAGRGEVWAINDPYTGGTHLPDITLVSVVDDLGIVCSRAHHADVGGMQPASMPAGATELLQEGVVIPPLRLTGDVRALLVANMRKPAERLADLRAQEACMSVGADRLRQLASRFGRTPLLRGMDELHAYSERRIRAGIDRIPDGSYEAEDVVEGDGLHVRDIPIRVRVAVAGDRVRADFTGTAPQQRGNVNCPIAVTRSAVYFCVRSVCDPDIPASGGAFVPVEVVAPAGCLVNARPPAAVVGGNTETSSRIVDVVMSALGRAVPVPAHGQGTMNNVTFGTSGFTYYETLGGGQGGGPAGPGPSAVHVAMSNTLNTPIEALEREYPLRIERYAVRPRTGGAGRHPGGDGVVRVYRVLADCRL